MQFFRASSVTLAAIFISLSWLGVAKAQAVQQTEGEEFLNKFSAALKVEQDRDRLSRLVSEWPEATKVKVENNLRSSLNNFFKTLPYQTDRNFVATSGLLHEDRIFLNIKVLKSGGDAEELAKAHFSEEVPRQCTLPTAAFLFIAGYKESINYYDNESKMVYHGRIDERRCRESLFGSQISAGSESKSSASLGESGGSEQFSDSSVWSVYFDPDLLAGDFTFYLPMALIVYPLLAVSLASLARRKKIVPVWAHVAGVAAAISFSVLYGSVVAVIKSDSSFLPQNQDPLVNLLVVMAFSFLVSSINLLIFSRKRFEQGEG